MLELVPHITRGSGIDPVPQGLLSPVFQSHAVGDSRAAGGSITDRPADPGSVRLGSSTMANPPGFTLQDVDPGVIHDCSCF